MSHGWRPGDDPGSRFRVPGMTAQSGCTVRVPGRQGHGGERFQGRSAHVLGMTQVLLYSLRLSVQSARLPARRPLALHPAGPPPPPPPGPPGGGGGGATTQQNHSRIVSATLLGHGAWGVGAVLRPAHDSAVQPQLQREATCPPTQRQLEPLSAMLAGDGARFFFGATACVHSDLSLSVRFSLGYR
jgi:hypothetical protein